MDFSDFELWFWRFYHGCRDFNFDLSADQEPKTLVDVRVVSMYYILYAALQKKPIFDSYRTFCDAVGKDTMDYPDFEFWYYRFYDGELNFDYDRSMDPVPKTIMDMPVKLMRKITENLDPVDRAYLRSMNRPIKDVVNSHPPLFKEIGISVSDRSVTWNISRKYFSCYKKENGCTFYKPNEYIESDTNYMEKSLKYLTPLLKIPKLQVHHLSISWHDNIQVLDDLLPVPFHAKSVTLFALNMDDIFPFLSAMNPGELESIHLKSIPMDDRDHIPRFFETEQFKQAKHVQLVMWANEDDLLKFSHLKTFKCSLDSGEVVDFLRVREIISSFQHFESCEFRHSYFLDDDFLIRTIGEALGEELPFGPLKTIKHRYQIPESNEYLDFEIEDEKYTSCTIRIVKNR
ncbi:hypothetical protein B9Z55_026916 [Caenorhabditis nigoni]|uniref:F-box domain-containing protein n=1 Tax=Caenorhabditis nigoni TaxID=1611254 RepID=A0A2G5SIH1_9PELO|nr:hypothetical protein B9Z55_026916 [Caenorhabditis nigoni]